MYYFESIQKQYELKQILDSWIGTPYRHWCGVKGQGADCIHFVARVFEEIGIKEKFKIERYAPDWHLHNTNEKLLNGIFEQLKVEDVGYENPISGDVILFHFGKASSHAAVYFDGYIYQAINGIGVQKINWNDNMWTKRRRFGLRLLV